MSIIFDSKNNAFKLDTLDTSYVIGIHKSGYPVTLYYGKKIPDTDLSYMLFKEMWMSSFHPMPAESTQDDPSFSPDEAPMEYPGTGIGDFRITAVSVLAPDGDTTTSLKYVDYKIYKGKPSIEGLPATYTNSDDEATTLEMHLADSVTNVEAIVYYTVFENLSAMARSVKLINNSNDKLVIKKVASLHTNLQKSEYEMIHMFGRYYKEHQLTKTKIGHEETSIFSTRGSSGHDSNPFAAFGAKGYTEETGDVYGFSLLYSGNFKISAHVDCFDYTCVNMGINPEGFNWTLEAGESFHTPEAVSVFSDAGLGKMSRIFHKLFSKNLVRGPWRDKKRPLLINSWEGTGMAIDQEKLVAYAEKAASLGFEMLVMDDGWFGTRDDDWSSLGDWYVHEGKFPDGLASMVNRIKKLGMSFGIWFEPEMISPRSKMAEEHPDWFFHHPKRSRSECRHQCLVDMTKKEVRDAIFDMMSKILSENEIDYVKWDYNRNFTEIYSMGIVPEKQGELAHRFIMGTYELMDRLLTAFPNLLLETCSGGGGRYDAGILYYSPQVWTSDNTDGLDREFIQFGTSLCYPALSMGSHVSRNGRCGGMNGMHLKGDVALWGSFGYEMNPTYLTDEESEEARTQVAEYHKYYDLIHYGDLYRLEYPYDNVCRCSWEFVSENKDEALLTVVINLKDPNHQSHVLKLRGLDPDKKYASPDFEDGLVLSGATLMNAGLSLTKKEIFLGDKSSYKVYFKEVK